MRTIKKFTSWMLIAAMLGGAFAPAGNVYAEGHLTTTASGMTETIGTTIETSGATTETTGTTIETTEVTTEITGTTTETTEVTTEITGTTTETTEVTTETTGTTTETTEATTETTESTTETTENGEENTVTNPDLVATGLSPEKAKVIVIDPGHCGIHPGASGNGLREEKVVLDIAKECQDKLNAYGDVIVYMTRDDGSCCIKLGLGDCLASRNNYAKILDADFLVSMHINAGASSGANVLAAYKSGYHDTIRKQTQAFGKVALSKLSSIGIKNRGLLLRKSEAGNRYSNGKLADYYSIVRLGVLQNVPSVIIEHGYITSSSDCKNFFNTKAKRKKVGNADAKAIISYYNLEKKVVAGDFEEIDDATYYITSSGKKAAGWIKNDGAWYYFSEETGEMQTGFVTIENSTFYLNPQNGKMVVGWFTVNGNKYLTRGNGTLVTNQTYSDGRYTYLFGVSGKQLKKGLHTVDGATYYLNSKRRVVSGIVKVKGNYYGFDAETYQMLYGYQKIKGKYYYLDPDTGIMARKQIVTVSDSKYYFGSSGARQTGWVKYKSNKYYFNTQSGKMVTGWKKIKGKYYYFSKTTGKMQKSKWIGKYYVNSKGVRTKKK